MILEMNHIETLSKFCPPQPQLAGRDVNAECSIPKCLIQELVTYRPMPNLRSPTAFVSNVLKHSHAYSFMSVAALGLHCKVVVFGPFTDLLTRILEYWFV